MTHPNDTHRQRARDFLKSPLREASPEDVICIRVTLDDLAALIAEAEERGMRSVSKGDRVFRLVPNAPEETMTITISTDPRPPFTEDDRPLGPFEDYPPAPETGGK